MDFAFNPYTTVLIPEPKDYLVAFSVTATCQAKCKTLTFIL
jgi:hypothetical protein